MDFILEGLEETLLTYEIACLWSEDECSFDVAALTYFNHSDNQMIMINNTTPIM